MLGIWATVVPKRKKKKKPDMVTCLHGAYRLA